MNLLLRRWALNRWDVIFATAALLAALVAGYVIWPNWPNLGDKVSAAIVAGWFAVVLATFSGITRIITARQSLIRLLLSEIKAMQYGLSTMDMFDFFADVHKTPESGARGFADAPRDEDYFKTFDAIGQNVGNLDPMVVEAIVRYYMYFKMSRDAASAMKSWETQHDPWVRKTHVEYVVKLLAISMTWGFVALWFMGFRASEQEKLIKGKMEKSYDAVFRAGEFAKLISGHPRSTDLARFFDVRSSKSRTENGRRL